MIPEKLAWRCMIARCENPKQTRFERWGGRGIKICRRWRDSFQNFFADVGPRPSPDHSIERVDNDGHYEPKNVRWATSKEQARNRVSTFFVEFRGETRPLVEFVERFDLNYWGVYRRIHSYGWSVDEALTRPLGAGKRSRSWSGVSRQIKFRGQTRSLRQWSELLGIGYMTLYHRLFSYGWSVRRAFTEKAA